MIAALFVETGGPYYGIEGVDPWDEKRDAQLYPGPYPVVAHPPCERWGRYAKGGPNPKARRFTIGDDGGCFEDALTAVRIWGGVLEHPEASHAWRAFGLIRPLRGGGWSVADTYGGWTCCVEQGAYGHPTRKATWLYAVGCELPVLRWRSPARSVRLELGPHSKAEAIAMRARGHRVERISGEVAARTPEAFRDVLIAMARSVRR